VTRLSAWQTTRNCFPKNVDAVTAATRAFGDLEQLQSTLEGYIRQESFQYFKMAAATDVDECRVPCRGAEPRRRPTPCARIFWLTTREPRTLVRFSIASCKKIRTTFWRTKPWAFWNFRKGHIDEARNWYAQAVTLDSQSYLAHYYFAAISMNGSMDRSRRKDKVESSLRASIKLNPDFAPSYDRLGAFLATRNHRNLDEARMMALHAVQLEPGSLSYRLSAANVLLEMERGKDAVTVIRNAMPWPVLRRRPPWRRTFCSMRRNTRGRRSTGRTSAIK
jgi:tetratricopeptide (TPR) repeat protein